ncbi:MAG: hypothetical protein KH138_03570 [Firmicutes bacterium]|nr:hypothetical protein [Bacillota bacterium]
MKKPMPWEMVWSQTTPSGQLRLTSKVTGEVVDPAADGNMAVITMIREAYKFFDPDFFAEVEKWGGLA